MKRVCVLILISLLAVPVFAKGPTKVQVDNSIERVENSQTMHNNLIGEMERILADTDNNIEYNQLLQRLSNKGGAMSWQKHLFDQTFNKAEREAALAEYKKLGKEYDDLVAELKAFEQKIK